MSTFLQTHIGIPSANIPGTTTGSTNQNNDAGDSIDLADVDPETMTPETFLGLQWADQLELVQMNGGSLTLDPDGPERLDVVASSDDRSIHVLQQLSKTDVIMLSKEDQSRIKDHLGDDFVFKQQLAASWGVSMSADGRNFAGEVEVTALVDKTIEWVRDNNIFLGYQDRDIYTKQLELLKEQASGKSFVSLSDLNDRIAEIKERAERALAFITSLRDTLIVGGREVDRRLNSLDKHETIRAGFHSFMAQERRILEVKQQRQSLLSANMDLPTLISTLQLTYHIQKEAEVAILTEELKQQNALLRDYAEMQRMVNDALKKFEGDNASTQKRNITGSTGVFNEEFNSDTGEWNSGLSTREARAMVMFSKDRSGTKDGEGHPLEALRGIERPLHDEVGEHPFDQEEGYEKRGWPLHYKDYTQSAWNLFSTQLADAVTLINQQSQILTNDISSVNQEKNRHFDLANSSLRRLHDMLTTIGRS